MWKKDRKKHSKKEITIDSFQRMLATYAPKTDDEKGIVNHYIQSVNRGLIFQFLWAEIAVTDNNSRWNKEQVKSCILYQQNEDVFIKLFCAFIFYNNEHIPWDTRESVGNILKKIISQIEQRDFTSKKCNDRTKPTTAVPSTPLLPSATQPALKVSAHRPNKKIEKKRPPFITIDQFKSVTQTLLMHFRNERQLRYPSQPTLTNEEQQEIYQSLLEATKKSMCLHLYKIGYKHLKNGIEEKPENIKKAYAHKYHNFFNIYAIDKIHYFNVAMKKLHLPNHYSDLLLFALAEFQLNNLLRIPFWSDLFLIRPTTTNHLSQPVKSRALRLHNSRLENEVFNWSKTAPGWSELDISEQGNFATSAPNWSDPCVDPKDDVQPAPGWDNEKISLAQKVSPKSIFEMAKLEAQSSPLGQSNPFSFFNTPHISAAGPILRPNSVSSNKDHDPTHSSSPYSFEDGSSFSPSTHSIFHTPLYERYSQLGSGRSDTFSKSSFTLFSSRNDKTMTTIEPQDNPAPTPPSWL